MRKLEEVKNEEWQTFLDTIVEGSTFTQTIVNDTFADMNGIEFIYEYEGESVSDILPLCEPRLIMKLYESDIDITLPLKQLNVIYTEMDKTNAVLFEYAMGVNRILEMYENSEDIQLKLNEIEKLNEILK